MRANEKIGQCASIIAVILATLYFAFSQVLNTGFFTSSFGSFETFLFYLPIPFSILASIVRIASGSRNRARPLEIINAVAIAAAGFCLLVIFPFNFSHVGDLLPFHLGILFSWIPNYLGRFIVLIAGIGGFANMIYNAALYPQVRNRLANSSPTTHEELRAR